ncbi:hypothetical protein BH11BAC5_BH11BAC5_20440 [soil metagenome]
MARPINEESKNTHEAIAALKDAENLSGINTDKTTVENTAGNDHCKNSSGRPLENPHQSSANYVEEVVPPNVFIEENEEEKDEQLNNLRDATNSDKPGGKPLNT